MSRRYVVCGLSQRALGMFVLPLLGEGDDDLSGHGSVVAVVDGDAGRVAAFNARCATPIPHYPPAAFDRTLAEVAPDAVIVASPDHTHADYIIASLRRDLDVITEKPMVISSAQARLVLDAERSSGANLRVAHNYRYVPRSRQIKRLLRAGAVGRVVSVELTWGVDSRHGASYFYRWNRRRAWSGGLSVHKSCHHFDLVSWWLDDVPAQAFSYGALNYYGADSPHNPGADLPVAEQRRRCPYHRRWAGAPPVFPADQPVGDGWFGLGYPWQYPADQPIYLYDEEIDIEDTYSSVVRYAGGASLAYSVTFSGPWRGYRVGINGTHGRIETSTARLRDGPPLPDTDTIRYYPLFGEPRVIAAEQARGGHDGADPLLRRDLLVAPSEESRELGMAADGRQGAYAVAVGEAVWRSAQDNRPYHIAELLGSR